MSVEQVEFVIPSSIEDRNVIKNSVKEMVSSKFRISGEQEYIKDTLKALAEKYDLPKAQLARMVTDAYKDSFDKTVADADMYQSLYETIMVMNNDGTVEDTE